MKEGATEYKNIGPKFGKNVTNILFPIIGAALFTLTLWILYRKFRNFHFNDVIQYFHDLYNYRLLLAILCGSFSYLMLTRYDTLGLRYIRHPLEQRKIIFTSFIGYAFSNNIGYSIFSGGFIRYRFYSIWGLSAIEITKVVIFCGLTSFLGYSTVSSISFLLEPKTIPFSLPLPVNSLRPLGLFFLILLTGYFLLIILNKRMLRIKKFEFQLPSLKLSVVQVLISSVDWIFASSTLYFLLPTEAGVSYTSFSSIFMLTQLAGIVSRIPGGFGVFEMMMVLLLPPAVNNSQIIGALLSFRIIYYLVPLIIALILMGSYDLLKGH